MASDRQRCSRLAILKTVARPSPMLRQRLLAECFGTFCLVFAGTGAIVVNELTGGAVTHVGVALTFGLIVLAMIDSLGDVSGCHINPAVTIGFWVARRFEGRLVGPYVAAQCLGGVLASLCLKFLLPGSQTLGMTQPAGSPLQSLVLEAILTLILMFVILRVSTGSRERGLLAGISVGAVVGLEAMFAGPISGASMNPARSFGPALIAFQIDHLWIYLLGPIIGAVASVPLARGVCGQGPQHNAEQ